MTTSTSPGLIALVAVLGATACSGFGATPPDPGAQPSGPHVSLVWSPPNRGTGQPSYTVGAIASDATDVFAVLEQTQNSQTQPGSLWRIPAAGTAHLFWQATSIVTPPMRVALDADNVYWVHFVPGTGPTDAGDCELLKAARNGAGDTPTPLGRFNVSDPQNPAAPGSCAPVGIAVDGSDVFVAAVRNENQYQQYQFSNMTGHGGDNPTSNVQIERFSSSVPNAETPFAQSKQLAISQLENAFALDASSLYWVESTGMQQNGPGWLGGSLVQMPRSGGAPTTLTSIAASKWPTGLAVSQGSAYLTLAATDANGTAGRYCALVGVDTATGTPSTIYQSDSEDCYGLAIVGPNAYTVSGTGEMDPKRSIQRIPLDGSPPVHLDLNRPEIDLRGVEPYPTGVLAVDYLRILAVPDSVFP